MISGKVNIYAFKGGNYVKIPYIAPRIFFFKSLDFHAYIEAFFVVFFALSGFWMLFAVMVHRLGKEPRTEIVHVYTSWSCIIIKNYKRRYPGNVAINHKEQFRSHSKGEMRNEQRQNKFHISNHGSKVRMNITNLTCHPYDAQYFFFRWPCQFTFCLYVGYI